MGDMDFNENEQAEQQPAPEKRKVNVPILKILMIAGIALAGLAVVYVLILVTVHQLAPNLNAAGSAAGAAGVQVSEDYLDVPPVYEYYGALSDVVTQTDDNPPASVTVKVEIGYEKNNKELINELNDRKIQLQDFFRSYFASKKAADLKHGNERTIKEELREQLNDMLKAKGVRDIRFDKYNIIEQ